jgi:hypothetical protein
MLSGKCEMSRRPKANGSPRRRLNLDLDVRVLESLDAVSRRLSCDSTTEAIRRAVFLADRLSAAVESGAVVSIERDGSRETVLFS